MADSYLAISEIATDEFMTERMRAAATQQAHLGSAVDIGGDSSPWGLSVIDWVANNRYLWAASPSWGAAWESALAGHPDEPEYQPGKDPAVITDGMILSTVQALGNPAANGEPPAGDEDNDGG
jgi:hypothetical protein